MYVNKAQMPCGNANGTFTLAKYLIFSYVFSGLCQVTVVSVASPTSNSSQKSVALPVNVALGQQILTVQQTTPVSPVKVATSQPTVQV